jgi:hypothetical protein
MDYSRPYLDSWGKMQFPWFIYSIAANCLAEIKVSGKCWLYHGAYTGLMYKDDNGTNDNGSAFSSTYRSKKLSLGDPTLEKKFDYMALSYPYQGSWNLSVNLVCDGNAMTEKSFNESMDGGLGSQTLWDNFKWDEANWSGESDIDSIREIRRQGKLIQVAFGTTGLNESWLVYNYSLHAKAIGRGIRKRES